MFQLLISIVTILVHFIGGLILYKKCFKYIDIYYYYIKDLSEL